MRLVNLSIEKLHGFLDITIPFYEDLTVIVGVNGSGKTSALTLMAAMLRLDIASIRRFKFVSATLNAFGDGGQTIRLCAIAENEAYKFSLLLGDQEFDLSSYNYGQDRLFLSHDSNVDARYFQTFVYNNENLKRLDLLGISNAAMEAAKKFLSQSKLTFVQLDRTIVAVDPEGEEAMERIGRASQTKKTKITEPIEEVIRVTKQKYLEYKNATERIKDRAYRASLRLHFEPISSAMQDKKKVDRSSFMHKLADMKSRVAKSALTSDESELKSVAAGFFEEFEKLFEESAKQRAAKRAGRRTLDEEQLDAILNLKRWQIERLLAVFEEEAGSTQDAYAAIRRYLTAAERFFRESGKRLTFDSNYELGFTLDRSHDTIGPELDEKPRSLKELSSGERQILIILTYLAFVSGKNSVFVIDEPELSLHLVWQGLLISAIKELRPQGCQVILATHAPEIAGRARDRSIRLGMKTLAQDQRSHG